MAKTFSIDGYIGAGYYSKQYIRSMLLEEPGNILINVSSLGGSLDHALDIHDQFAKHGKVTIEYNSFNASSATIISLGASKIKMSNNSFYLIHKVMSWVDQWGYMNEDDLQVLIDSLEKEKGENAKITLIMAKMYAAKTGKTTAEIIELMKQQTWLSAEEALAWGFVDEIFEPKESINVLEDQKLVAMISAAGFPIPKRKSQNPQIIDNMEITNELPKDKTSFLAWLKESFTADPKEKTNVAIDPKDQRIADLEAENTVLKTNAIAKVEPTIDPKDQKIAELEAENTSLRSATVQDPDVKKDSDTTKSIETDDFMNDVANAKILYESIKSFI